MIVVTDNTTDCFERQSVLVCLAESLLKVEQSAVPAGGQGKEQE